MLLHEHTWSEVEHYLQTNNAIIMPIGSTEQHGPNGLIGTDALTADHIARGAGARAKALVAPVISVGIAQHHMAFTGTMTVSPSTLIRLISEYVGSLQQHGFRRFYFLNGHGGNIATIKSAFQEIYTGQSQQPGGNQAVTCKLRNWWDGPQVRARLGHHFADKDGSHATASEISVTQYLFPNAIKAAGDMGPPSSYRGGFHDAEDYRRKFPDGRIGAHSYLANPEAGRDIYDTAIAEIADDFATFASADSADL